MRWIFLTLLMANFVLGAWFFTNSEAGVSEDPTNIEQKAQLNNLVIASQLTKASPASTSEELPVAPEICKHLGPMKQELNADQVVTRMASLDIEGSVYSSKSEIVKDYWVYLPPLASQPAAKAKLSELNKKGIESFLFTTGDLANGISLGLYSNRNNALRRVASLKDQGYDASVSENRKLVEVWWVKLTKEGSEFFNEGILENLSARYPDISVQEIPCNSVESAL